MLQEYWASTVIFIGIFFLSVENLFTHHKKYHKSYENTRTQGLGRSIVSSHLISDSVIVTVVNSKCTS